MANPLEWENKNALLVQGSVAVSNEIKTAPGGVPKWIRDDTTGSSDKVFTVPTNKIWKLKLAECTILTSATAGNRFVAVFITDDSDNIVYAGPNSTVVGASVAFTFEFHAGSVLAINNHLRIDGGGSNSGGLYPMPEVFVPAGYKIHLKDIPAIDDTGDSIKAVIHVIEYDA